MMLWGLLERAKQMGPTLLATLVGVVFALWVVVEDYSGIEGNSVNARFTIRNHFEPWNVRSDDIVFLVIDDDALDSNLKEETLTPFRWPWPRYQWADLHYFLHQFNIKPAAVVYDVVFDMVDEDLPKERKFTFGGAEANSEKTNDQHLQAAMEQTADIPTFLACLFQPQGLEPFTRTEYAKPETASATQEMRSWQPPPPEFIRFSLPYDPDAHDPIYHAQVLSIPWDSKWWHSTLVNPPISFEELDFTGRTASLLSPAAGAGTTTMNPEEDGITRAAPLFFEYDGRLYPSLPLQVVMRLLWKEALPDPSALPPFDKITFKENVVELPKPDGTVVSVPVDERKRLIINFRYPFGSTTDELKRLPVPGFQYLNFWRLMDGFVQLGEIEAGGRTELDAASFDPRTLRDKVLIIGSSAAATLDLRPVPIAGRYPMMGTLGEIIRSIMQQDFLHAASPWFNALWIIGGAFLVGLLGQFFAPIKLAIATVILFSAHALLSYFLFTKANIIVDFFHVTFAEIVAYAVVTISQYLQVSSIFGRYVTPQVRRYLLSNRKALELGGQETEVSILFSDLSGFTSMSEKMEAKEVIATLNSYFGPMFRIIIDEEEGTLDKLIGDAIMAYFGHPLPTPDHPRRAVTAALKMQNKLSILREQWIAEGKPAVRMRVGVNTGSVVAGNMGDSGRTDYSIIGDTVNLASRLESNAPVDGVLISETTYERVKDFFVFNEKEPIKVKGKEKPVKVYEVVDFA